MKAIALAICLLMALTLLPAVSAQSTPDASTFVMLWGRITSYSVGSILGTTSGWCGVFATIGESAQALMAWSSGKPTISVVYNFYVARLLNTTLVALNYGGADLYIQGYWSVHNVTFVYQPGGGISITDELLVDKGQGIFSVANSWKSFTAQISGVPPLVVMVSGTVIFYAIRSREIPMGDVSGPTTGVPDGKVNIYDLVHVARHYGATPGDPDLSHPQYDFSLDFDFDYKIDIYDVTTIAVNIGKSY
jgi:hypothetical protein